MYSNLNPPLSWFSFTQKLPTDVMDTTELENFEIDEDYCCEAEDASDLK